MTDERAVKIETARENSHGFKPTSQQMPQQASRVGETPAAQSTATTQSLAAQAMQHYDRALQAQREGDWTRYGEEIKRLGAAIEQISKQR